MQAIKTTYLRATNRRPSRIKAECVVGEIIVSYNTNINAEDAHIQARNKLLEKLNWMPSDGMPNMVCGQLKDGSYVHVFLPIEIVKALRTVE